MEDHHQEKVDLLESQVTSKKFVDSLMKDCSLKDRNTRISEISQLKMQQKLKDKIAEELKRKVEALMAQQNQSDDEVGHLKASNNEMLTLERKLKDDFYAKE